MRALVSSLILVGICFCQSSCLEPETSVCSGIEIADVSGFSGKYQSSTSPTFFWVSVSSPGILAFYMPGSVEGRVCVYKDWLFFETTYLAELRGTLVEVFKLSPEVQRPLAPQNWLERFVQWLKKTPADKTPFRLHIGDKLYHCKLDPSLNSPLIEKKEKEVAAHFKNKDLDPKMARDLLIKSMQCSGESFVTKVGETEGKVSQSTPSAAPIPSLTPPSPSALPQEQDKPIPSAPSPVPSQSSPPTKGDSRALIIPASEVNEAMSNFSKLRSQARMVPNLTSGNLIDGFKVSGIQKKSIYESLGMEENDILKRVNGEELDTFEKATNLFTLLRDRKLVSIELLRNGALITYTFEIR